MSSPISSLRILPAEMQLPSADSSSEGGFADTLRDAMDQIGEAQAQADIKVSSVLAGMVPMDLRAIAAFTVLLGLSALLAAYIPARRAARLDPMAALHHE